MRKFKTVVAQPSELSFYRARGEECYLLAKKAYEERMWFGTTINAVHAAIALSDALSIFLRRTRYAGQSHDEAVTYYSTLQLDEQPFKQSIQRLGSLLSIKHRAEYAGEMLSEKDAETILKQLERLRDFINSKLPSRG